MKFHISICCLLVSANFAFFVTCTESITNVNVSHIIEKQEDNDDRWQREIAVFRTGLKVKNDKGELVELTTNDAPPNESARRGLGNDIFFYLYTRKNPVEPHQLTMDSHGSVNDLLWSFYDYRKPTYFITHGWLNTGESPACVKIRDAYLKKHEANVIIVDWGAIAISTYGWAVKQVSRVGKKIAEMIEYLMINARLNPKRTTLVGHSLGAHVMGIAGHNLNGTIKTIFGLDPALPMFSLASPGGRITREDAKHVQIIHTNAGFLGFENAVGTSDFYPDGGSRQLSCKYDLGGSCSHSRSYEYFAESIITTCGFYGKPCKSKMHFVNHECKGRNVAKMGGLSIRSTTSGIYYLWTNCEPPYAAGPEAL